MRENRSAARSSASTGPSRGAVLAALVLLAVGIILLLNNFYFLGGFNAGALWPLGLVAIGGLLLVRGELLPSSAPARSFGISRGSVEAAMLEVQSGEVDVRIHALAREGRLLAGQFGHSKDTRPELTVQDGRAVLRFDRSVVPWHALADWEIGLARDLPWEFAISSGLGEVHLDLSGLIIQSGAIATGLGNIHVTVPQEAFAPLSLRSSVGTIRVICPPDAFARVTVKSTRLFKVHVDATRYNQLEDGSYLSIASDAANQPVEIEIRGTFGDAYLA